MRPSLTRLTLRGFKTIRELKDFEPGRVTILIGANGAGKSNFLSFFRMLSRVLPPGGLKLYVAEQGGASKLLHDGPAKTREIYASLDMGQDSFGFRLYYAADDALVFADDWYERKESDLELGTGRTDPEWDRRAVEEGRKVPSYFLSRIDRSIRVYDFGDTSVTARVRTKWAVGDGWRLKDDGGNLAPFMFRLRQSEPDYYQRIVGTLGMVLPFFDNFEFQPEFGYLILQWRERGSDLVFSASQAGDGMLRAMALVALLQQPEKDLPDILCLDEPELGLHPYALELLAALIQSASYHCQVIVATQSVSLVDRFEPHDIVVVDRVERESTFRWLNDADLAEWRERYTLSELWEKNVLGGTP